VGEVFYLLPKNEISNHSPPSHEASSTFKRGLSNDLYSTTPSFQNNNAKDNSNILKNYNLYGTWYRKQRLQEFKLVYKSALTCFLHSIIHRKGYKYPSEYVKGL